ncbi:Acyl-CoA oxidase/dehydrogenase, type 1 domain protein [Candidatus Magnetomorum sp. HK-1]|nr:Acyl-CoA oxidase/dehydrogenase, type 1 domain protein [Candidatus Magnetomorum sp. HK-1]
MNFSFTDHENSLFQEMESILKKEKDIFENDTLQTEKDKKLAMLALQEKLFPLGYLNGFQEKKSIGPVNTLGMMRIFARYQASLFLGIEYSCRIFNEMIQCAKDDDQRQKIQNALNIESLPDPKIIGTIACCEDFVETDTTSSKVTAQVIDDEIFLSGQKLCVINASLANWIAITGNFDDKGAVFFIPSSAKGLSIKPRSQKGIFSDLMMADIHFDSCLLNRSQMIVPVQLDVLISHIQSYENMAYTACALGMIDQCVESASTFAKTHQSENKPMIAHQAVAFALAEMLTLKQTAELLAFRAAWALETDDSEKAVLNHCAKVFCTETAEKVASQSMGILGGQVFQDNHVAEQAFQNSKFIQLAGTSTHLARVSIGNAVLKRR